MMQAWWVSVYGTSYWNGDVGMDVNSTCFPDATITNKGEPAPCDNKSWEAAFGEIATAFMSGNFNRDAVTEFITFFRQFMIDFFKAQDHEAMIKDGLAWVEPILRADCWKNLDDLLADKDFSTKVKDFEGMFMILFQGMHWDNKEDMKEMGLGDDSGNLTPPTTLSRKRRSNDEILGELQGKMKFFKKIIVFFGIL